MDRIVLETAVGIATRYLNDLPSRHVGATATLTQLLEALGGPLPEGASDPVVVLEQLAQNAEPGLVASAGPRYFGFVTGGAVPVTVGADWIASTWDQNSALFISSPAISVIEDIVGGWLLEMLGLPARASVGFVTGCHMANFTCLAAARHEVLRRAGWNVETQGLQRAFFVLLWSADRDNSGRAPCYAISAIGGGTGIAVPLGDQAPAPATTPHGARARCG